MTIEERINEISKRIDRLETGGKPFTGTIGEVTDDSTSLPPGSQALFTVTVEWSDSDVTETLLATPLLIVYIDTDNDTTYQYGGGSNIDEENHIVFWYVDTTASSNTSKVLRIFMQNEDTVNHIYYAHASWSYIRGVTSGDV